VPRYRYFTADVFTDRAFGGNPLAVFPDGQGLTGALMQRVARELNLSETVFVLPPEDAANTRRLRIFTPATELPFAGHPTVGTAFVLAKIGDIALGGEVTEIVFEEGVGPVPVTIRSGNGQPQFAQLSVAQLPEFGSEIPSIDELAATLSLAAEDILTGNDGPQVVSCGVPFLFVPLRDRAALGRARMQRDLWERHLAESAGPQVFVFCRDPELPGSDIRARMFAPAMGIEEDPATGAAASALAGYLAAREAASDGTLAWTVEQGFEMGRPSLLEIEADKAGGAITAVRVGGRSVMVSEGSMEIPV